MLWSSLATRLFFFFILRGKKEDLIGHQSNTTKRIFSGKGGGPPNSANGLAKKIRLVVLDGFP